jgi:hypothetical protein
MAASMLENQFLQEKGISSLLAEKKHCNTLMAMAPA